LFFSFLFSNNNQPVLPRLGREVLQTLICGSEKIIPRDASTKFSQTVRPDVEGVLEITLARFRHCCRFEVDRERIGCTPISTFIVSTAAICCLWGVATKIKSTPSDQDYDFGPIRPKLRETPQKRDASSL
jgi:hypothetical protein